MKETKKMMGVIEAQYRKANEEYIKGLKEKKEQQRKQESFIINVMFASLLLNVMLILGIVASLYW